MPESHNPSSVYEASIHGMVDEVHFSSCGKYVVITEQGNPSPEIIPIDVTLLQPSTFSVIGNESADINTNMIMITPTSGPIINAPNTTAPKIMSASHTTVQAGGYSTGLNIVQSHTGISVRRWQGDAEGSSADVLQLTKLPNWSELQTSSATIGMPHSKDDAVRVILNKTAKQWSDMSEPADTHLPALVSRDTRTLQYASRALEEEQRRQLEEG